MMACAPVLYVLTARLGLREFGVVGSVPAGAYCAGRAFLPREDSKHEQNHHLATHL